MKLLLRFLHLGIGASEGTVSGYRRPLGYQQIVATALVSATHLTPPTPPAGLLVGYMAGGPDAPLTGLLVGGGLGLIIAVVRKVQRAGAANNRN